MDTVNYFQEQKTPDAYKCAIESCISRGILANYLKRKGSEVNNMLIAEYDYDLDIEVQREEAFEDGMQKGLEKGLEKGIERGIEKGLERVNELNHRLMSAKRFEDMQKALDNADYQKRLFEEFNL